LKLPIAFASSPAFLVASANQARGQPANQLFFVILHDHDLLKALGGLGELLATVFGLLADVGAAR